MVLRIDSRLHVVADDTAAARHHRTGIRVGQRNLFVRGIVELSFDPLKLFHLRFELGDFIFQAGSVWRGGARNLSISRIERSQITADARLDFFHASLQFGAGEIAVTVVHCLEFAAVDGNQVFAKQPRLLAEQNELAADAANGLAVVFSEVGDGLEIGHQTPG
jgi:hypothetical protein